MDEDDPIAGGNLMIRPGDAPALYYAKLDHIVQGMRGLAPHRAILLVGRTLSAREQAQDERPATP